MLQHTLCQFSTFANFQMHLPEINARKNCLPVERELEIFFWSRRWNRENLYGSPVFICHGFGACFLEWWMWMVEAGVRIYIWSQGGPTELNQFSSSMISICIVIQKPATANQPVLTSWWHSASALYASDIWHCIYCTLWQRLGLQFSQEISLTWSCGSELSCLK